jgi:hypothetical protein
MPTLIIYQVPPLFEEAWGKTISSNLLAAACCNPGATWLYRSMMMAIPECPKHSE